MLKLADPGFCRDLGVVLLITCLLWTPSKADDKADSPFATPQERLAAAKPRVWNDRSGKFSVDATLVKIDGDKVVLRRADRNEITVENEKLSEADQSYIANFREKPSADSNSTPAGKPQAAFSKDLVATDYRTANFVDLSAARPWTYKPDSAPSTETLRKASITLKEVGQHVEPSRLLLVPHEKRAYVVLYEALESHTSQVQACNLQSGKLEASEVFGENEIPVDISSDGRFVLSEPVNTGPRRQDELYLYALEGQKVKPLRAWRPFISPGMRDTDFDTEVYRAVFADPQHVLTLTSFGKLIVWDVPTLKPIWAATIALASTPALSGGGKYVAIVSTPGRPVGFEFGRRPGTGTSSSTPNVSILNVADGTVVAKLALDGDLQMCSVALSEDGSRLALFESSRMRVWDLQSQELVRDFALQAADNGNLQGRLDWVSNKYLLLSNGAFSTSTVACKSGITAIFAISALFSMEPCGTLIAPLARGR